MSFSSISEYPDNFPYSSLNFDHNITGSISSSYRGSGSGFMDRGSFMSHSNRLIEKGSYSSTMLSFSRTNMSENANFSSDMSRFFNTESANYSWFRKQCFYISSSNLFSSSILAVIGINTLILALQTTYILNSNYGWYFAVLDQVFLGIYIMEMLLKIYVYRWFYFKSGWNNFDFLIVMSSIISFLLPVFFHSSTSFDPKVIRLFRVFRALRAIRSLRALRAITFLRSLQVIVQTLLRSIPAMSSILSLSGLILYIFAVIGRTLFSTLDPKFFGTLGISIFRLFAFITLDNWSDAFRTNTSTIFPSVFFFQFFYVILESFVFLNLFIAVIVSNLSEVQKRSAKVQRMDLLEADTNARASRNATDKYQNSLRTLSKDFNLMDILQSDQGIENYYPPHLNRRTKQLLSIYFMEVAALERFGNFYSGHVQTLEDLVDLIQSKKGKR